MSIVHRFWEYLIMLAENQEKVEMSNKQLKQEVVITDIDIKFWSMVGLMVKAAFAAIPAVIIIWMIVMIFSGFFAGFMHGIM